MIKWDAAEAWFRAYGDRIEILPNGAFKVVSARGNVAIDADKYRAIHELAHGEGMQKAVEWSLAGAF